MKLRLILLNLTLMAFFSASVGGYLYYSSLKESAFKQAETDAITRVGMIGKNLSSFLSENIKPVRTLAGTNEIRQVMMKWSRNNLLQANITLDHFNYALNTNVCYIMNAKGETVASSNRYTKESFVHKNFSFRPYFKKAVQGRPSTYLALGTTSAKRGAYYSHPIYGKHKVDPIGVVVIKASIEDIENDLVMGADETILVTDPNGVIFISTNKDWLYKLIRNLSPEELAAIKASRQFGDGPWNWIGYKLGEKYSTDKSGNKYLTHYSEIDNYPGWKVVHLRSLKAISKKVTDPLIRITGPLVLTLCILVGASSFVLFKKASREILRREEVETALRISEERYRTIYHNTPAMLHSVNREGRIVSVSDHWAEALGYERDEVVGEKLVKFMTEESGLYAQETVLPEFLESGVCNNIPYRFVKKSGELMDVILTAFGERDDDGKVVRSLAVSVDVTEQRRAEKALKHAKEELSLYSRDLERQVRKRTGEITGILTYAPDVIYIKDAEGRYLMVNPRFEELFGVRGEEIRGRTDAEILPEEIAGQFREEDMEALAEHRCLRFEKKFFSANNNVHTYLAVKFPVYGEDGESYGVCGILTDITEVKKAQDRLRRLSGGIMANQEKERGAIARELHDELGQILTALRIDAVWILERLKGNDSKAEDRALMMCELIDNTIMEVRNMALRLRPGVLDDLGLVDALEWYITDFERRTEINCYFEHKAIPAIPENVSTAAYRIAQEAITNVARHANADAVNLALIVSGDNLKLIVQDDGNGFDADLSESEGLGVAGMRERAGLAGGELYVSSQPGIGTNITFRVPLEKSKDEV